MFLSDDGESMNWTVVNSEFYNNKATYDGGAIAWQATIPFFENNTY